MNIQPEIGRVAAFNQLGRKSFFFMSKRDLDAVKWSSMI